MKKLVLILFLVISTVAIAKNSNSMSKKTYDVLMKSQKLIEEDKLKGAKNLLLPLLEGNVNPYEKSYILQTLANIEISNNNYDKTAKYYKEIIKINSFEPKSIDRIKFSLSKIYLSLNKYNESIKLSKELLSSEFISKTDIYETLTYASYYKQDFKSSISYIQSLLQTTKERKENWYQILYSSYVELKNYKSAISTLNIMVKKWHKNETYWLQLIALYQETNNLKKALSTFELAYKKGGVDPKKNTLHFVNILIQNDLYFKAATQLEMALNKGYIKDTDKNFKLLVSCFDYAKQQSKVKEVLTNSKFAKTAKYQLLLGNIYYNEQNYEKSIKTLEQARIKRGTKEDGQRNTILALSYYELNNKKQTHKYLQKAINNPHEKRRALSIKKSLHI